MENFVQRQGKKEEVAKLERKKTGEKGTRKQDGR